MESARPNILPSTSNSRGRVLDISSCSRESSFSFFFFSPIFAGLGGGPDQTAPSNWIYRFNAGAGSWTNDDDGITVTLADPSQDSSALLSVDATGRLWAAVYGGGVYLYETNRWLPRNGGLTSQALRCTFLCHDPVASGRLLLGTEVDWIFQSDDGRDQLARD